MIKNRLILFVFFLVLFQCKDTIKENSIHEESSNDLIHETSPYLLQHAYNPVDWKAWNDETLALAKKENKPIIISIGYSACHWCHVMEEESFEDDSIAKIMNTNFINIKVDREERPDIDKIYIDAVQLMTGKAGWPLNCITLPNGKPIFGGTYFTKKQWQKIIIEISELYKNTPEKAINYANKLTKGVQDFQLIKLNKNKAIFNAKEITNAVNKWATQLDYDYGGFKGDTKFPLPNSLDFLLRYSYQFKDNIIKQYTLNALNKIAFGGIYDHVSGGFSRYSVDAKWHIPHFEKMLYDNAQLVSLYSKAYLVEKNSLYKTVVIETLDFIEKQLTANNGAFYSSIDADSYNENQKLEEGAYYVWTAKALENIIDANDYELFKTYYNINDYGLWEENKYVLIKKYTDEAFAEKHNIKLEELKLKIIKWKSQLLKARYNRKPPNLDDKVLTSWNALMLQGYIDAYKTFGEQKYLGSAIKNAEFILKNQLEENGKLYRNYKQGKSTINAYAEDYATVIQAFISLYEVTSDQKWLLQANHLLAYTMKHFYNNDNKMFFFTSNKSNTLISRKTEIIDGVIASSNSIMANNVFKLGHYFLDSEKITIAKQMLNNVKFELEQNPSSYSNWLNLMINYTKPYHEVVLASKHQKQLKTNLFKHYLPNVLVAGISTENTQIPLLKNKFITNETYIYVCNNGTCKLPKQDVVEALKLIDF